MTDTIIFVGDSYCACTDQSTYDFSGRPRHQWYVKDSPGHPALVSEHYRAELVCHGYSGKSWWYSRSRLQQALKQDPALLARTRAVVFCHTDATRVNSSNEDLTVMHLPKLYDPTRQDMPYDPELADASRLWLLHLHDYEFQDWAQQQYFRELAHDYSTVKTIHFHNFKHSVQSSDLLPGMVYTTPLMEISTREPGVDESWVVQDGRANHLNPHNNRALAQVIIGAIDNYRPGLHTINLTGFDLI